MRKVLSLSSQSGEAGVYEQGRTTAGIVVTISKMAKLKGVVSYGCVRQQLWAEGVDL
jgi:hypothetical protein